MKINNKNYRIEIDNYEEKIKRRKDKLRMPQIYIDNDLTNKEREIQRIVIDKAKDARNTGKSAKVRYKKLTIEGMLWTWNNKKDILEENPPQSVKKTSIHCMPRKYVYDSCSKQDYEWHGNIFERWNGIIEEWEREKRIRCFWANKENGNTSVQERKNEFVQEFENQELKFVCMQSVFLKRNFSNIIEGKISNYGIVGKVIEPFFLPFGLRKVLIPETFETHGLVVIR